jgi:hypothetical protein
MAQWRSSVMALVARKVRWIATRFDYFCMMYYDHV